MINSKIYKGNVWSLISTKAGDYAELIKLKLNMLVVITSLFAYFMSGGVTSMLDILVLLVGGLLISGASGAMNEVLEISEDAEMKRTRNRPLPASRMSSIEAWTVSILSLAVGLALLAWRFNTLTLILCLLVVVLYAFVYTPLKKKSPLAVLVGAIPGALPPVIGVAAATGQITPIAIFLFILQFMWQFPHFWAVAIMAKDDYKKAGFKMIPNNDDTSRFIALQSVFYTTALIMMSVLVKMYGIGDMISVVGLGVAGLVFTLFAINFYRHFDYKSARQLMFSSISYLPIVYLIMLIDYIIK